MKKKLKTLHVGTHLRVLSESFPMNTNMAGFRWFSKIILSLWTYVALALEVFTGDIARVNL